MKVASSTTISNFIKALPLKKAEFSIKSSLMKMPEDIAAFSAHKPLTRAELCGKFEKYGLDSALVGKVVNDCDTRPEILNKVFENINSVFSDKGIKPAEWFEALKYTGASPAFTRENLRQLEKIDFSGLGAKVGSVEKLLALNSVKSSEELGFVLIALEPMKKEIRPLDLASVTPDMVNFLKNVIAGSAPIGQDAFISLARATKNIRYPYEFFVEMQGRASSSARNYDVINNVLFGAQSAAHKRAAESLFKETGVKVHMDNNLDPENIEYLREFINITRASGDEIPKNVYITNLIPEKTAGEFAHTEAFFTKPVVNLDGKVNEKRLSTMAHENAHFLDYKINKNNGYAANSKSAAETEMESDLMELFVSSYSRKNREEFIAEIKKLAFEGKILKYKNKYGQTVYRRYFSEEITDEIADDMKPHFAYLLRKYQKFNGPLIRDSILPVPPKNTASKAAKNYVEVTQRDINTAMPPDFYY